MFTGIIEAVGKIDALDCHEKSGRLRVRLADAGEVKLGDSVDGISLTVAGWKDCVADIAVIPFTYEQTNLCSLAAGDAVNLETDILAKYVESLLEARHNPAARRWTIPELIEEGF